MSEPALPDATLAGETAPVVEENVPAPEIKENPAWQPFFDVLPTSLHETVRPVLKEWDQGVNSRFQEIHSKYDPYKDLVEQQLDAEQLMAGYQLLSQLNADPKAIYEAIAEHYGFTAEQVTPAAVDGVEEIDAENDDPRFKELRDTVELLSQIILNDKQGADDAAAMAELDSQLANAKEKHGEFDEIYVLTLVQGGMDVEKAVEQYKTTIDARLAEKQRPPAPAVIGGNNGAVPQTGPIDVGKLEPADRRALVSRMLAESKAQD